MVRKTFRPPLNGAIQGSQLLHGRLGDAAKCYGSTANCCVAPRFETNSRQKGFNSQPLHLTHME